jgi:hypothetical protein
MTQLSTATQPRLPLLKKITSNPITGIAPWILLAILEGPLPVVGAVSVALALSMIVVAADRATGSKVKILSAADVLSFSAFLILALFLPEAQKAWLETWFGELSQIVLVLIAVGSMAVRVPFTIQYAKEQTDPEAWDHPLFKKINYVITGVWALAFLVGAIAGFIQDMTPSLHGNVWLGWVIPYAAIIAAARFTGWYPDAATAKAQAAGQE